jgi:hypothetical protein
MFSLAMIYALSRWDSNTTATELMKGRPMSRTFRANARYESAQHRPASRFSTDFAVNLP